MNDYVCIIGGINIDIKGIAGSDSTIADSHPGKIIINPGGVARNISENLACLDVPSALMGCVGDDYYGNLIINETNRRGVNTDYVIKSSSVPTAKYLSVSAGDGELSYAVNDMKDSLSLITPDFIEANRNVLERSSFIAIDTNLSKEVLENILSIANISDIPVYLDTVSSEKAMVVRELTGRINYLSPNLQEYESIFGMYNDGVEMLEYLCEGVFKNYNYVIVKKGEAGVDMISIEDGKIFTEGSIKQDVVEPNGAGDAFNAGFIYALTKKKNCKEAVRFGICAAHFALSSVKTVSGDLTVKKLNTLYKKYYSENAL